MTGGGTGERLAVGGHIFGGRRGVLPFAHPGHAGRVRWVARGGERLVGGLVEWWMWTCMSAGLALI